MDEIGVQPALAGGNAFEKRIRSDHAQRVPAHMRDFEVRIRRRDGADLALDPAEARRHPMLKPALSHELEPDADAEKRLATLLHGFLQSVDHAWDLLEAPLAVGKGADAGEHDAVCVGHVLRAGGDLDGELRPSLARGALERLGGGVQSAGALVYYGDVHGLTAPGRARSPPPPRRFPLAPGYRHCPAARAAAAVRVPSPAVEATSARRQARRRRGRRRSPCPLACIPPARGQHPGGRWPRRRTARRSPRSTSRTGFASGRRSDRTPSQARRTAPRTGRARATCADRAATAPAPTAPARRSLPRRTRAPRPVPRGPAPRLAAHKPNRASRHVTDTESSWLRGGLKLTFGRWHAAFLALVDGDRLAERTCERLIAGLGEMVAVLAIERFNMQRDAGMLGEGLEPFAEQLGVHLPDLRAGEIDLPHEVGAPRDVDRDAGERLVHGQIGKAVAGDALLVAKRLCHRLAEHDAAVLGGVVLIDMQVAFGLQEDVDHRMARELLDHVIEEADAGLDCIGAAAVEVDGRGDGGLLGAALDGRAPLRLGCGWLLHGGQSNARLLTNPLRLARGGLGRGL